MDMWAEKYPQIAAQLESSWPQWQEGFDAMQAARDAGYDLAMITEAVMDMTDAVGERYVNDMDPVYAVFVKVLKHFPEY